RGKAGGGRDPRHPGLRQRICPLPQPVIRCNIRILSGASRALDLTSASGNRDSMVANVRSDLPATADKRRITAALLAASDAIAAIMLAADLLVVCVSVILRYWFNAPVEWSDDVARGLMVGSSFFGAASALARAENPGVRFFIERMPDRVRAMVDSVGALLMTVIAGYVAFNAIRLGSLTAGQTAGSGLPLELTFYPMGIGALFMTVFALDLFRTRRLSHMISGVIATALIAGLYLCWDYLAPASVPSSGTLMLVGFFATLFGGLPIG